MKTYYTIDDENDLKPEQRIYQYIPLKYFYKLLETNKFHISQKTTFEDKNETQLPLKSMLNIHWVGENAPTICDKQIKNELELMCSKMSEYKSNPYKLASCWTYQEKENILMWKSYAFPYGVRIETTIDNFITSIIATNYDILVGKIKYERYHYQKELLDFLFSKEKYYQDEREIRFYFTPTLAENQTLPHQGKDLNININDFIHRAILSPFHTHEFNRLLKKYLQSNYSLNVHYSDIQFKC